VEDVPLQNWCGSEVRILERNLEACERVTLNLGRCNARYSRPVAVARSDAEILILWLPFKVLPRAEATHE